MRTLLWIGLAAVVAWNLALQRRLQAALLRGDMYRDISMRLDRRASEQTAKD